MSTIWRGFFILLAAAGWIAWGPAAALAQTKPAVTSAIGKQPELNLYAPDKRHPSLAGTYLATCVVFAALTAAARRSATAISPASTRRPRNCCRRWHGKRCRNITGSSRGVA